LTNTLPTKPNNVHMMYSAFLAQHTVAMTTEEVITWDTNAEGRAGLRERLICRSRQHVEACTFTVQHTVAVTAEEVITWGANGEGQAGQGERAEAAWVKPRSLRALRGALVTQVVCGSYHTLCVTATSQVILPARLVALLALFCRSSVV